MTRQINSWLDIALLPYLSFTEEKGVSCHCQLCHSFNKTCRCPGFGQVSFVVAQFFILLRTHTNIPGRNHKSLEYIVVDRLKETGRYQVYRHIEILQTPDCLESFDCHKDGQEEDAKPSSFRPHHHLHLALVARNFYCSTAKVDLLLPICIKYSPTFEYGRFFGFDNCLNKVPI